MPAGARSYDDFAREQEWSCALLRSLGIDPTSVASYALRHDGVGEPIRVDVTYEVVQAGKIEVDEREYEVRAFPIRVIDDA